jgi:hypothetical protein
MGLDVNGIKSLLYSKKVGIDFSRTAMIGRQMYFLSPSEFESALESFGYQLSSHDVHQLLTKSDNYIEPMLSLLGAKLIHSFDCTGYEGATHVHDMNCAIPESMKGQYSLVIDSGTLEHVFNYPVAINGKTRITIALPADAAKESLEEAAKAAVEKWMNGQQIKKIIVIPGRMINIVV